jgi:hypothetical protein
VLVEVLGSALEFATSVVGADASSNEGVDTCSSL